MELPLPLLPIFGAIKAAPPPIPDLKAPRGPLPQGFLETHGVALVIALTVLAVICVILLQRRRAVVENRPVISPLHRARQRLSALAGTAGISEPAARNAASAVLREYAGAVLGLPGAGATAEEIGARLRAEDGMSERFVGWDTVRFDPMHLPGENADAVIREACGMLESMANPPFTTLSNPAPRDGADGIQPPPA